MIFKRCRVVESCGLSGQEVQGEAEAEPEDCFMSLHCGCDVVRKLKSLRRLKRRGSDTLS